jgi:long-chain fatty acid transport protein
VLLATAPRAHADGGVYSGSKGAHATGRGGAFVAKADDLSAAMFNPAGFSQVEGIQLQVGNRFSRNSHSFKRQPTLDWGSPSDPPPYVQFETVRNKRPWQYLEPLVGVGSKLGLKDWTFAYVVYAPPGVGRQEFPIDGGQRYMMVERNVVVINHTFNAAWQPSDQFAVGVGLQWIYAPQINYSLVVDTDIADPDVVTPVRSEYDVLARLEGSDPFTLNAIIGAWYRPLPFLQFGIAGQVIPTAIETDSTLDVEPLTDVLGADERIVLRRDGKAANDVTLKLPLPITARLGVRYFQMEGSNELFDVEFDVVYETWSRVDQFTMDGDGLTGMAEGRELDIGRIELQKHWKDTVGLHLGSDVTAIPELLKVRGGLFYESAVANPSHAHIDFVSGKQLGGAIGTSLYFGPAELGIAYEYRHQPRISVSNAEARVYQEVPGSPCDPPYTDTGDCDAEYLGKPSAPANAGVYRAHSHVVALDVMYRF